MRKQPYALLPNRPALLDVHVGLELKRQCELEYGLNQFFWPSNLLFLTALPDRVCSGPHTIGFGL